MLQTPVLEIAVDEQDRNLAIVLLQEQRLPTSDITEDTLLYLLRNGERVVGTAGLEIFEDCALLRSISIVNEEQGTGLGKIIVEEIEKFTRESGITCLFLLTTSAKGFFEKLGYCAIGRDETPVAVKKTAEFTSLCPDSAIVMKKRI